MRKQAIAVALSCASLALPAVGHANTAKPEARKETQVVTVAGKNICYGEAPAPVRCDFKLPVPARAKTDTLSGWLRRVEARFALQSKPGMK